MENDQFLQQLRICSLKEGRCLIAECASTLDDQAAFGVLLADEALEQSYANPSISLKLAELLIFFGEQCIHPPSHALGLKAKGDILKTIGLHRAALACLDEAGAEFLQLGDEGNWARSRISWIISCNWLGETERALQEARRAHDTFIRLDEPYWACVVAHNMAVIYEDMGRYEEALRLYDYTSSTYPALKDLSDHAVKRAIAITRSNQAYDLALVGHPDDAYRLQQQARASFIDLGDISCVIKTEMYLADLDYTYGHYASTLRHCYDALDLMEREAIDEPPLLASLKLCVARCYMKLDRVQEACKAAEEAVAIQQQPGVSLEMSNALSEYAVTLIAAGRLQEALTAFAKAITLFNEGGLTYHMAITKLRQAELLLEMGRAAEAYEQAARLKKEFEAQNLTSRSVHAGLIMVGALKAMAQPGEAKRAIALGKRVAALARRNHLHEEAYKSQYLLGQLFDLQKDMPNATKHYAAAIAHIERVLDHLVFDLSPAFLRTTWDIYEEMIDHCLQQSQFEQAFGYLERARSMALRQHLYRRRISQEKGSGPATVGAGDDLVAAAQTNGATILRLQKELTDWQEQHRMYSMLLADPALSTSLAPDIPIIEQELKRCEAKVSELFERLHLYQSTSVAPSSGKRRAASPYRLDIARLQRQLGPEECLLAYFTYKEKLVIFALTAEELITREYPGAVAQLERLLPILYAHLSPAGWPDTHPPSQGVILRLLQKLHTILLSPLSDILTARVKALTIVPYGLLHDLPFQALYDGTEFLIEHFQFSYLPASSLVTELSHARRESPGHAASPSSALIFGYSGNGSVQRVLDEASTLAMALNGRCYLEREATIAHLFAQAPGSPIIHIATHGRVRLDAPHFSSVLLADGQFNAIDAFQLDVKACHLVTLSGCDTGKALIGGGDEQLGLGRAFLAAGARSLVMSLWPVEDSATTILMQEFYQHLLAGETKAEALRAAQRSFLHSATPEYAHPYFWAAFRLVGDTGELPPRLLTQPPVSSLKKHGKRHIPKACIPSVPYP